MGQSMNEPQKAVARRPDSRFSARSLQKSSRKSTDLEKKVSLSVSKMQNNFNNEPIEGRSITENTDIRTG